MIYRHSINFIMLLFYRRGNETRRTKPLAKAQVQSWPQLPHHCAKWGRKDSYPDLGAPGPASLRIFSAQPVGVMRIDHLKASYSFYRRVPPKSTR